jgi:hypothetical protein
VRSVSQAKDFRGQGKATKVFSRVSIMERDGSRETNMEALIGIQSKGEEGWG